MRQTKPGSSAAYQISADSGVQPSDFQGMDLAVDAVQSQPIAAASSVDVRPELIHHRAAELNPEIFDAAVTVAHAVHAYALDPESSSTPKAYLVGGLVRDACYERPALDGDMEVDGISAESLQQILERLFPGQVHSRGAAAGVFEVRIDSDHFLEVAIPTGSGGEEEFKGIEESLKRRNFTCNAIALDPICGEVIDPCGGCADIARGQLRVVDQDLFEREPVNIFKAAQVSARLGAQIEPETLKAMQSAVETTPFESLDRGVVTRQWQKLFFHAEKPSAGVLHLMESGALEKYYPELAGLAEIPQDPRWHPEGDVLAHTLLVLDAAAKAVQSSTCQFSELEKFQIMLSALYHDSGKISTTQKHEDRVSSAGHEETGVPVTREALKKFSISHSRIKPILSCVRNHMQPVVEFAELSKGQLAEKSYQNHVRKVVKGVHPLPYKAFLTVCEADIRGRGIGEDIVQQKLQALDHFSKTVQAQRFHLDPLSRLLTKEHLEQAGVEREKWGEVFQKIESLRDSGSLQTTAQAESYLQRHLLIHAEDLYELGYETGSSVGEAMREIRLHLTSGALDNRQDALLYARYRLAGEDFKGLLSPSGERSTN